MDRLSKIANLIKNLLSKDENCLLSLSETKYFERNFLVTIFKLIIKSKKRKSPNKLVNNIEEKKFYIIFDNILDSKYENIIDTIINKNYNNFHFKSIMVYPLINGFTYKKLFDCISDKNKNLHFNKSTN